MNNFNPFENNFFERFELLDSEKIKSAIEPENLSSLAQLMIFESITSTNTYLLAQAKAGAPSGSVCLAEQQTAGRGRRGREWVSPPLGNIYCSFLWRCEESDLSGLSIAVAVMLTNVLKKYGVSGGVQLKWPNDILFDARKLGGILLERSGDAIVIGIGLNIALPKEAELTWIGLSEIKGNITRNYLVGLLLNELLLQLPVFQRLGVGRFIDEWRKFDSLKGKSITVHTPSQNFMGIMLGVNEKGELTMEDEKGEVQSFCYGEVSVRNA